MSYIIGPRFRTHVMKDWTGGHRLFVCADQWGTRAPSGHGLIVKVASDFVWSDKEEGAAWDPQDGIGKADDLIQSIMDRGWEAGFRPRQCQLDTNELTSTKYHLEDMRRLVFAQ